MLHAHQPDESEKRLQFSFPQLEEELLSFWEREKIFEKSMVRRKGKKHFVFFEGPPTANGTPGVHHVEARSFKDVILRYKTMQGYFVPRRAGWDTHGLPVEVQVEKELGLKSKKDIEQYGVAAFNKKCKESVWRYKDLWEQLTARMGFWIDMKNPYVTYDNSYIESLWWIMKEFSKRGYLYEDYKIIPWCSRCGTGLSSHELAQGYETVKDTSVYVKFPVRDEPKTFFLVWTTTAWSLPGDVALAVHPSITYAEVSMNGEKYILAESRLSVLGGEYTILRKMKGAELFGKKYQPPYPSHNKSDAGAPNMYSVVGADFVSTNEGTGIVHIAPAFGEEDFAVGKKNNVPVLLTLENDGTMKTPGQPWNGIFFKKANDVIMGDLKTRSLLFKEELYEHDYPFCWRCKTPLVYMARKTWWVAVNKVREQLLKNNETINWHPEHLKEGRFGGWLKEKKDWAFSRERYWGTPLPVWRCAKCEKWEVIGSIDELASRAHTSGNAYFMMRHGEAEQNVKNILNGDLSRNHFSLTKKGRKQVDASATALKKKFVEKGKTLDFIFTSPFLRAGETAEIVRQVFGVSEENVKVDPRLSEIRFGVFDGKSMKLYQKFYKNYHENFTKAPEGGETAEELKARMWESLEEIESRYQGKNILIVSHEYPLWMLWTATHAKNIAESIAEKILRKSDFIKTGTVEMLDAKVLALPRGENQALDLHKPYIDEVRLTCSCKGEMKRTPEVADVWFDSGSMPFAADHWPFAKSQNQKIKIQKLEYPADYIVEGVDQTRGWFYSLLATATLLGKSAPYKNVISVGILLDVRGKKMSKSLGNIVDPIKLIDIYGADPVRWYFFTINQPGDSKLFHEEDIKDVSRRFFMILWNVFQFYELNKMAGVASRTAPKQIINRWVLARLSMLTKEIGEKLDAYDIVGAARMIEQFVVEDVSRWYVRRIRDLMKSTKNPESKETRAVLQRILLEVAKILAPFAPFIADTLYRQLGGNKKSVHLDQYPAARKLAKSDENLLSHMQLVRAMVSLGLEARAKAGVKVRQPLAKLTIKNIKLKIADRGLLGLIQDEVNVKEIAFDVKLSEEVLLDTVITPELKEEGMLRDLVREIQSARKMAGLSQKDKVTASIVAPKATFELIKKYAPTIKKETNSKAILLRTGVELKIFFEK